jgi:hypothetical protein
MSSAIVGPYAPTGGSGGTSSSASAAATRVAANAADGASKSAVDIAHGGGGPLGGVTATLQPTIADAVAHAWAH